MKIICNKAEFAKIVLNCYKANGGCNVCLLDGICGGGDSIVALADVEEEWEPIESRTCSTCKWYESPIVNVGMGNTCVCRKHTGLAKVTPYTSCSYWEPIEMVEAGEEK